MSRIKSLVRKALLLKSNEDLSIEERRKMWPPTKTLSDIHIKNCRLVTERSLLLNHTPKGGVCAEIGVGDGGFSQKILEMTSPEKLHLFDNSEEIVKNASMRFSDEISKGKVLLHHGDSSSKITSSIEENYFDWVYIDGDHTYEGCKKDLLAIRPKMKKNGLILLNDYTYFSIVEFMKYGVVEAVNEFCIEFSYEILFMALQDRMYNDVFLRPIE